MLAAAHPGPATSLSLGPSFAAGHGTITVGRLEQNVLSAISMNTAAAVQLPEKLVNMVGTIWGLRALPVIFAGAALAVRGLYCVPRCWLLETLLVTGVRQNARCKCSTFFCPPASQPLSMRACAGPPTQAHSHTPGIVGAPPRRLASPRPKLPPSWVAGVAAARAARGGGWPSSAGGPGCCEWHVRQQPAAGDGQHAVSLWRGKWWVAWWGWGMPACQHALCAGSRDVGGSGAAGPEERGASVELQP